MWRTEIADISAFAIVSALLICRRPVTFYFSRVYIIGEASAILSSHVAKSECSFKPRGAESSRIMAAAESRPNSPLIAAAEDGGSMRRPLEEDNALAQFGSSDAYEAARTAPETVSFGASSRHYSSAGLVRRSQTDRSSFSTKRWLDYAGLSLAGEARDFGYQAAFHPDDRENGGETCRTLFSGNGPAESEIRLRRYDGMYRWFLVRVEPFRDETGKILRWYGTSTDIEALKKTEEKLREDERDLRRIIDAIPQAIVVQDPVGSTLYANRATLDYTGLAMEDVLKPNFRERIFHPDDIQRLSEYRKSSRTCQGRSLFEVEQRALWAGTASIDGSSFATATPFATSGDASCVGMQPVLTSTTARETRSEQKMKISLCANRSTESLMFEEIVGSSQSLRKVLKAVDKVAATNSTVLILGETGTGKELIARAIHKRSSRAFIRVNCAAMPSELIASELFGHEKGAFTGAVERRINFGRFEAADGGTLFLDEIGDLPAETQITLLRVLQEREFERIGSTKPVQVDVRVLAATNRDLAADVEDGDFPPRPLYRLNVFPVEVPPLGERIEQTSCCSPNTCWNAMRRGKSEGIAIDRTDP